MVGKEKVISSEGKKIPGVFSLVGFLNQGTNTHTHTSTIDYVQLLPHVAAEPSTHLAGTFM